MNFTALLTKELLANLHNNYKDNYDYYRFGNKTTPTLKNKIKDKVKHFFQKNKLYRIDPTNATSINAIENISSYLSKFDHLFGLLNDNQSKELLVKIISYRILGETKVKLPLSNHLYWEKVQMIEELANKEDSIPVKFMDWKLYKFNLKKINYPIHLYFTIKGTLTDFILKQYEYHSANKLIKAMPGDYVIDAGACWGDTALYFAHEVGNKGKVYSFEFIPSNINILKNNLALNSQLKDNIEVVFRPLWDESGKYIYFTDNGPGSKVGFTEPMQCDGKAETITIDELVSIYKIPKVNFIKMDIEGAEPFALKGALETIKRFKPKLAIAIYHSLDDFVNIPVYLDSLNLGYKFYLGHYTIHSEETILFAQTEESVNL